jgi:hypothetical protein
MQTTPPEVMWRDIETAPKSGRILVCNAHSGVIHAAEWSKNPFSGDEAWRVARINDDGDCLVMHATHWMPLPTPPEGQRHGE